MFINKLSINPDHDSDGPSTEAGAARNYFHFLTRLLTGITVFLLTVGIGRSERVDIVTNGSPAAAIILPASPSTEVEKAGKELQRYIEKCTGATLEVLEESRLKEHANLPTSVIYVGPCEKTGQVIDLNKIKPEELVLLTRGRDLYIAGRDGGTLYGVYRWLHEHMGVDWIFPGEVGEVTPRASSVSVSGIDYRFQPPVMRRNLRGSFPLFNDKVESRYRGYFGRIGIEDIDEAIRNLTEGFRRSPKAPFTEWGAGGRIAPQFGHSFNDYWEKYGEKHPDFFALQPNGSREQNPVRERLCVSNPQLWDFVAERKIEEFKANPEQKMSSLGPNDGGPNKFCMCERCQSWDPPEAPKIQHGLLVDPRTGERFEEYPSLSDRYFRFYNEVAKRVAKVYPDRKLGVYAYSVYRTVPVNIDKLEPNLVVSLVSLERDLIDAWSKLTGDDQLFIRPNVLTTIGFVKNDSRWLVDGVRFAIDHGAMGFDFDNLYWSWGSQGLDYYVLVRTMWDPSADTDQLVERFCQAAFGSGSPSMRKYYRRLEELSSRIRDEGRYEGRRSPGVLAEYYTDEVVGELQGYVDRAKSSVGDPSSREYQRIVIVEEGLEYTRLGAKVLGLHRTAGTADPAYRKAEQQLFEFIRTHLDSYGTNVPGGSFFLLRAI